MKLSDKISLEIIKTCNSSSYDILLPNFFVGGYEMDVFKVSEAGFISEYEIKISKSDFKADFKKDKKHDLLNAGKLSCNRYYFVTPKGLLEITDIPKYAGWYEYSESGRLVLIKNAPLLHKNKFTDWKRLAQSASIRESIHRGKLRYCEYELKQLRTKVSPQQA